MKRHSTKSTLLRTIHSVKEQLSKSLVLILLILTLVISLSPSFGQEFQWAKQFTGPSTCGGDVVVDASGNLYVVGSFGGTANFGLGIMTAKGANDFFFAKFNSSGVIQWIKNIGTPSGNVIATGCALYKDASNNIFLYVSGYLNSYSGGVLTFDFDPGSNIANLTMADNAGDAFVAKYDANGIYKWATVVPSTGGSPQYGGKITVDGSGNAYTASYSGSTGLFKKFNASSGVPVFANSLGSGSQAVDVAFRGGYVYVAGFHLGSSQRPIVWYDVNGNYISSTGGLDRDFSRISLDNTTGIYAVGGIVNTSSDDIQIEKYTTTASSTPVWSRSYISGINGSSSDIAYSGATDGVIVSGWFRGTIDFNNAQGYSSILTSSGSGAHDNIFVARYFTNGNVDWVKNNTSNTSNGNSNPIAIGCSDQSVHVVGLVSYRTINASFCGVAQNIVADASSNGYLAKYTQRLFPSQGISGATTVVTGDPEIYSTAGSLPAAKSYNWSYPSNWIINRDDHTSSIFTHPQSSGSVAVNVVYDCGTSNISSLFVTVGGTGGGPKLVANVYPNPTASTLVVSMAPTAESTSTDGISQPDLSIEQPVFDLKLFNATQNLVLSGRSKDGIWEGDISNLPRGDYYLKVNSGDQVVTTHVQISN